MQATVDATIMHDTLATSLDECEAFVAEGTRITFGTRVEIIDHHSRHRWQATAKHVRNVRHGYAIASLAFDAPMRQRPAAGSAVIAIG